MGTQYRVDRNDSRTTTPLGMNSLLYLGDSLREASAAYAMASPGVNAWNEPDAACGVTLARWRGSSLTGEYVVERSKFAQHMEAH